MIYTFPKIEYKNYLLTDITKRIVLSKAAKDAAELYQTYSIEDGESAEQVAYDFYGSTDLTWLIYAANNIVDPFYGWPMSSSEFNKYIEKKYINDTSFEKTVTTTIAAISGSNILDVYGTEMFPNNATAGYFKIYISGSQSGINDGVYTISNQTAITSPNRIRLTSVGRNFINTELTNNVTVKSCSKIELTKNFVKYYLDKNGMQYPADGPIGNMTPITAYDDDVIKNENKRKIKIIRPFYVNMIIHQLQQMAQ